MWNVMVDDGGGDSDHGDNDFGDVDDGVDYVEDVDKSCY